ncbi:MucR family transcriptional regulator [Mesorhizobium sp. CO1-1-8]|uniref:MucR family transcriptional regulator n=1 Tax=Mesorhizobium sp. CO1-1-8 TaxID=2876631 RepID=UPI001CD18133|nr:MucR family transcriptional regulator [Mesorhizobium sp. CO1-1-8]MBZ9772328.1 MucR family transcriptional regulator [Mesorhizobium sp. CO1-1-8]
MDDDTQEKADTLIGLAVDVVSAYVSNNPVPVAELPNLIHQVHAALQARTTESVKSEPETLKPAVPIRKSVTPDYIVSLEDGRQFKSLKRHLATHYGMTPAEYRTKWSLPADYPMVAPSYAAARSAMAKAIGLGRKAKQPVMKSRNKSVRKKAGV